MFGSTVLEIGIGMTMLFLFTSLLVTAVTEMIEARLQTRAGDLERGIRELFNDHDGTKLTDAFYAHPIIYSLFRGEYDPRKLVTKGSGEKVMSRAGRQPLPAYIPAGHFATAVIDLLDEGRAEMLRYPLEACGRLLQLIQTWKFVALSSRQPTVSERTSTRLVRTSPGGSTTMDRVSGWYRKRVQTITFALGLSVAVLFNIDAIDAFRRLSSEPPLREAIVAQATPIAGGAAPVLNVARAEEELKKLGLGVGWHKDAAPAACANQLLGSGACERDLVWGSILTIVGWLVTAVVVTLGAPFWFDLLNKFMVIRSTVKPNEKSQPEVSEDRQTDSPARLQIDLSHGGAAGGALAAQPGQSGGGA